MTEAQVTAALVGMLFGILGSTIGSIVNHWLTLAREKRQEKREKLAHVESVRTSIRDHLMLGVHDWYLKEQKKQIDERRQSSHTHIPRRSNRKDERGTKEWDDWAPLPPFSPLLALWRYRWLLIFIGALVYLGLVGLLFLIFGNFIARILSRRFRQSKIAPNSSIQV